MNRVYCDSNNVEWVMFNVNNDREPPYDTPSHLEIKQCIESHLSTSNCVSCTVPLPYFSVPMWVAKQSDVVSPLNYLYCVCCECGLKLNTPGQLMIMISLGMDSEQTISMTWRVCLRGMCCNPDLLEHSVYYPFILSSQQHLISIIETGWSSFDTQTECTGCSHWECKFTDDIIKQYQLYNEHTVLDQLLWHFYDIKLDVVTPLVYNKCARTTCGIPLKYCKNSVACDTCRKMVYCSEKCVEEHHCEAYYKFWLLALLKVNTAYGVKSRPQDSKWT